MSFSLNTLPPGILIWAMQLSYGRKGLGRGTDAADRGSTSLWVWGLTQYCSHLFSLECDYYTGMDVLLMLLWLKGLERLLDLPKISCSLGNNQSLEEVIKNCGEKGSRYSRLIPLLPPFIGYHLLKKAATLPSQSGPSWSTDNAEVQGLSPLRKCRLGCSWKLERMFPDPWSMRQIRVSLLKFHIKLEMLSDLLNDISSATCWICWITDKI